ncbi:transferrin receptor-like dimerization domain-containing protein [Actinomadura sp. B10D3]|uniref:transferrin receptor-like dimerization domain-containing protein n=1 Tax=Actinomadura sp. B10D3 TaxID=3153557 RepID=UPI00325CB77A
MLIYSDPADDGFARGPVYPDGPWRAADGIQRGSVAQIQLKAGDPQTPGRPSVKGARRIPPSQAPMLKGLVPTTPISYGAAEPLLRALNGDQVPEEWQGGLPFAYRFGPGGTKVHLDLKNTFQVRPLWDVTVRIPGSEHPEQEVILGAHHDAWTSVVVDVSRDIEQAKAWQRAAEALQARADAALRKGDTAAFRRLNDKIMQTERDLLTGAGLPGRPWYRPQVYAPGIDTGYATQRLPALNDALFVDRNVRSAKAYEARLFGSLRAATRTLAPEE